MFAAMEAVRMPTTGSVEVIDLIAPVDGVTTAFLASLYAAIGCQRGCLELATTWDLWLDETGMVEERAAMPTRLVPAGTRSGRLTRTCTAPAKISGACVTFSGH